MDTNRERGARKRDLQIVDIHTHVLPGIDDGARDWDMSMGMLKRSWDNGVRTVIATPHFVPWEGQIPPERIRQMCREAEARFSEAYGLEMAVYPGEELYYYSDLVTDLREGRAMTMHGTGTVLVEFGLRVPFGELQQAVLKLKRSGYRVILAHYERYSALAAEDHVEELLDMGVRLQSNLQALQGGLLDPVSRRIKKDYKRGRISFTASDMHNLTSRPPMEERELKWLRSSLDQNEIMDLFYGNAAAEFSLRH